jgi:CMP-N-acetylneuraminic acid synthetase
MKLHVLIPARGGSKGIIKKNIQKINGKSLVEISIDFALSLKINGNIFISSDMEEIKKITKKYDKNVVFDKRPLSLSKDKTSTQEVVNDLFYRRSELNKRDILLLLEPTSPLRKLSTINFAIKTFREKQLNSMASVIRQNNLIIGSSNNFLRNFFDLNTIQRQKRKILYEVVGVFYLSRLSTLLKKGFLHNNTYLHEVSIREGIDINNKADLDLAREILGK